MFRGTLRVRLAQALFACAAASGGPAVLAALAGLSGCADGAARPRQVIAVPWPESPKGAGTGGKAEWIYLAQKPTGLLGKAPLADGKTLYFGQRGERWIHDGGAASAEAAGDLAEQDLVALARPAQDRWLFVGRGGAVFEAGSPLGAFTRVLAPPEPLARVDASGALLAAVTTRGALLVSRDGGLSFSQPKGVPFVTDVALGDGGAGLALALPEKLFATTDAGVTWSPVDVATVGASRLARTARGVAAVGYRRMVAWQPDAPPRVRDEVPDPPSFSFPVDLAPPANAASVRAGGGFVHRGMVFVAVRKGRAWLLGRGKIGERMETSPLAGVEGCQTLALEGDDQALYGACSQPLRGASLARVRVLRWASTVEPPDVLASPLEGPIGEARLALGPGGRLLASGVCRPGGPRGCEPDQPLLLGKWVSDEAASLAAASASASARPLPPPAPSASASASSALESPWTAVSAPALAGRPLAMRFGAGQSVYLVARRAKAAEIALFVSHDGGRTFETRELQTSGASGDRRAVPASQINAATISVVEEGIVSVALEGSAPLLVVTDEDGRLLSASSPPSSAATTRIGVAGRRALAVDGAMAFETEDGGASWRTLGEIGALRCEKGRSSCDHPVACAPVGCLVGGDVARVGWGAAESSRQPGDLDPKGAGPSTRLPPPPIVCRLGKEKWTPLPAGVAQPPDAYEADRGKTAWATFGENPSRGSVFMVHGLPTGKIEEASLLAPTRDPAGVAVLVQRQIEGAVAIRFPITAAMLSSAQPLARVEVAWENLYEGKLSRGTIADTGASAQPGLSFQQRGPSVSAQAQVDLASVSAGGTYVRFLRAGGDQDNLFFVDHRGQIEKQPYPSFPERTLGKRGLALRADAVRVDGKTVPFATVRSAESSGDEDGADTLGFFRARPGGGPPEAISIAPGPSSPFGIDSNTSFSYQGGQPLFVHLGFTRRTSAWSVDLYPFRADGPVLGAPIHAPSQGVAMDKLRACNAADRAKTPRIVAGPEPGTRRAIIVEGPDGARFAALVSQSAVLYGTFDAPCVGTLDAVPVQSDDVPVESTDRVLVPLSDLEHAWFFRVGAGETVETRTMRCKVDPAANVPPSVVRALEAEPVTARPGVRGGRRRP